MSGEGKSTLAIARILTEEGIPSPGGHPVWQGTPVRRILTNPAYLGKAVAWRWHGEKNESTGKMRRRERDPSEWLSVPAETVPPLVTPGAFALAAHRLATNKQRHRGTITTPTSASCAAASPGAATATAR
jgi:site-specific DNA recombinase